MIELDLERFPRLTEGMVQLAIADYVQWWRVIAVPNLCLWHEMDMAVLTRAGCLWEFEIKCSQADWEADRQKDIPAVLPQIFAKMPPGDEPGQLGYYQKHYCKPRRNLSHVERFTYVYAEGLTCPNWVPDFAGLIEAKQETHNGKVYLALHLHRSAKSRRVSKMSQGCREKVLEAVYYRFWRGVNRLPVHQRAPILEGMFEEAAA